MVCRDSAKDRNSASDRVELNFGLTGHVTGGGGRGS
jgi:hypothetical protein